MLFYFTFSASILSRSMSGEVKQHMHTFCVNKEILSAMTEKKRFTKTQAWERLCWPPASYPGSSWGRPVWRWAACRCRSSRLAPQIAPRRSPPESWRCRCREEPPPGRCCRGSRRSGKTETAAREGRAVFETVRNCRFLSVLRIKWQNEKHRARWHMQESKYGNRDKRSPKWITAWCMIVCREQSCMEVTITTHTSCCNTEKKMTTLSACVHYFLYFNFVRLSDQLFNL